MGKRIVSVLLVCTVLLGLLCVTAGASGKQFTDVSEKAWYAEAVEYAVSNGLMNGVGNNKFDPEAAMSRAMLVTVLWRYAGEPKEGKNTFRDVPGGQWYTDAVAWAAKNGVVNGVGDNRFAPEGKITREQMATILFRYANQIGVNTGRRGNLNVFADYKQVSEYALTPMRWAVAEGIIGGSDGCLLPNGDATRAQVAAILMRFITKAAADKDTDTDKRYSVALITDYGDITDEAFNQTTYEAGKAWCAVNGVDFTYYKPTGDSTAERVAAIDQAVADGYNVLLLPGFTFAGAIVETAEIYPDVKYIALDVGEFDLQDAAGTVDDWSYVYPENVFSAVYQEELAGYMAGYAAVKLGYKHLGFLGGMAVPAVVRYGYGFVQGCDAAAAEMGIAGDITIEYVYGNQFYGDADITAYMDTWYQNKGVEVVFACGGGIFTSAAEAAQKVKGAKVIGVDVDQKNTIDGMYGDGITLTSAMKGLASTVNTLLTELILNNNWEDFGGKVETLGLLCEDPSQNFVQIAPSTQFADGFTEADYRELVSRLLCGDLSVSDDTANEPKVTVTVLYHSSIT